MVSQNQAKLVHIIKWDTNSGKLLNMGNIERVRAEVFAGVCGYTTVIEVERENSRRVSLKIKSECENVQNMAEELTHVDPFREIGSLNDTPTVLRLAQGCNLHTACPVPIGIIKAVEVAAGLALPADSYIKLSNISDLED